MEFVNDVKALIGSDGFFLPSVPVFIARSPGRLDLMGGNDGYTGGLVFESTIREATYAAAQLRNDQLIVLKNKTASETSWQYDVTIALTELCDEASVKKYVNNSPAIRWTTYVLGGLLILSHLLK